MTERERTCETCAFGGDPITHIIPVPLSSLHPPGGVLPDPVELKRVLCHWDNTGQENSASHWCRHWAETTGWDRFEKRPTGLEKSAYIIFKSHHPDRPGMPADVAMWLEEYRKNC